MENQYFGLDSDKITKAELTASRNLYSLAAQKKGLSLWAITWTHEMTGIGALTNPALYVLQEVQGGTDLHNSLDSALEMQSSTLPEHGSLQDNPPD